MDEKIKAEFLAQNQLLITQMSKILDAQTSRQKKPVNKHDLNMDLLVNYEPYSAEQFIELLKNNETNKLIKLNDILLYEKGYVNFFGDLCLKLLQNTEKRPLHTYNVKTKVFLIYEDEKWKKINYQDFKKYIKRIAFFITKAIIGIFIHQKRKIIDEKGSDWLDHSQVILMSDTNEVLDDICCKMIEALKPV